jgi:hypothetical protein
MTAFVLALAGLAAGDAGPGPGAARAPVGPDFAGPWEGTYSGEGVAYTVEVRARELWVSAGGRPVGSAPFALVAEGEGLARMELYGVRYHGIYQLGAGRVLICVAADRGGPRPRHFKAGPGSILIALRPVAPRKR